MKVKRGLISVFITGACYVMGGIPYDLTIGEGFLNPIGFYDSTPVFSWKLPEGVKKQNAYWLEVCDALSGKTVWNSRWVQSEQSVFVPYGGEPLKSRQQLIWRVRFCDSAGWNSEWSKVARFELGLLSSKDWKAKWIRPAEEFDPEQGNVSWLRREFGVSGEIRQARLYVTARGVFQVYLNDEKVGHDYFANGWTAYTHRIDTLTYDVSDLLKSGENAVGAMLGAGWYAGRPGWERRKELFGLQPELLLQLEIMYADGSLQTVVSDGQWKATFDGPVLSSDVYAGENYDAGKEMPGWNKAGFDDAKWSFVRENDDLGPERLSPKPFPPVRIIQLLPARAITEPETGKFVFDFGQNMAGWARLRIPVEKERTVTIRFAEMLNADGTLHTTNYREAETTDTYTAAENGMIEWEPAFTYHGFRYVELSGLPENAKPKQDWVTGVVLHSDLTEIGTFESSHEKLSRLQSNIVWSLRSNFFDIPTDCPQRNERFGWTGDAQIFCPTAMFNYDCLAFFRSWLGTMRDEQLPDGQITHTVPSVIGGGSSGWIDAATIIPWEVYVRTGDSNVLAENYEMMKKLVGWYQNRSENNLISKPGGFGDWLQPYAESKRGDTSKPLIRSAFFARSTQILADSARVLGRTEDAAKYAVQADAIRKAFAAFYFDTNGRLKNSPETQTAYSLAFAFNLIPNDLRVEAGAHLVRLVHDAGDHLRTGFLGTPYITQVLDQAGYTDLACTLLFQESYPSWFYSINQGATTMWERWDAYSHKNGFGDDEKNSSLNHYAYGAIGQWMVERIAGLKPDADNPGYKHFFVCPVVGKHLTWARAELQTPYGKAVSGWKKENGKILMEVVVPPNTTATVEFPNGREPDTVSSGSYQFDLDIHQGNP